VSIEEIHFAGEHIDPPNDKVGESGYFERIVKELGFFQVRYSCISCPEHEEIFRSFLRGKKIEHAVEIGTFFGTATAVLAHYADRTTTIDIRRYFEAARLWLNMGVLKKITHYIISEAIEDKIALLNSLNFDFAFIDGNHRKGAVWDYELVKKCGRVLFHDYFHKTDKMPEIMTNTDGFKPSPWILEMVDSLPKEEVTIKEPFAYWEKR
jgi:hypothetical protein